VRRRLLDLELVRRGLAETRSEARDAVLSGRVTVGGRPASKPGSLVGPDEPLVVHGPSRRYASRGGEKLAAALDRFGVNPAGRRCLDAGASTGGFTDVLLARGAAHVVAVDVGYGQLDWRLRRDDRVTVMERTNARDLTPDVLPYPPELVTADLSFISLAKVVPALLGVVRRGADLVLLVKPQFEAEREEVRRGGVVSDPGVWRRALERVTGACRAGGAGALGAMASPVPGPAGNVEFFVHAGTGEPDRPLDLDTVVAEGLRVEGVRGGSSPGAARAADRTASGPPETKGEAS
jgi:23S rRNA (cytidine1920-2'-O)/16S rRNA (cytidine1409-2'-O)-methyltransferase